MPCSHSVANNLHRYRLSSHNPDPIKVAAVVVLAVDANGGPLAFPVAAGGGSPRPFGCLQGFCGWMRGSHHEDVAGSSLVGGGQEEGCVGAIHPSSE